MLYYITNTNIPTKKAFGYPIAKMCTLFAKDEKVTLVIPKKKNREKDVSENIFSYYDLPENFSVLEIPVIDASNILFFGKHVSFLIEKISFAISVLRLSFSRNDLVYSRDLLSIFLLKIKTSSLFLEIHYLSKTDKFLIKYAKFLKKVIVITSFLKKELETIGFDSDNILIAPDSVDLSLFEKISDSKKDLRIALGLPIDKKIIVYSGNLFKWKGVFTLVDSIENLPEDVILVVVGGSDDTLPAFKDYCLKKTYSNKIIILGYKKYREIPAYLKSADILSLPNSALEHISKFNTSPLKLFEYMATGNPIISSDLPSMREILSEKNAFFAEPDDANSLFESIKYVLNNKEESVKRANQALDGVKKYTWIKRAENIMDFIKKND